MKKSLAAIAMMLALSGCGMVGHENARLSGYSKLCVDGITYLQFTSGAAVQVDKTGNPVTCIN